MVHWQAEWSRFRMLWAISNVRWLALTQFLTQFTLYSTVIVAFQTSRGLSLTEMFLLESLISLVIFVFEIPTGILADRLGYRRMMILGQSLFLASYVVFPLAFGFWPFALSTLLFGVGLAAQSGCDSALLYESLPEGEREGLATQAFGLTSAAATAGFVSGTAVGSFLGAIDPVVPVALNILPMALALAVSFRLKPVAPPVGAEDHQGHAALALLRSAAGLIRREPALVGLRMVGTAGFALLQAIFWYNQPLFERAGIAVAWFGPLTALALGGQMLLALVAGAAERRLGVRGALLLAHWLPALAYLLLARPTGPLLTALLVALVVGGGAWRQPVISGELNRRIPTGGRATALSALSFLAMFASISINPLIGWMGDIGLSLVALGLGGGLLALGLAAPLLTRPQ